MEAGAKKLTGLLTFEDNVDRSRSVMMPGTCVEYGGSDGTRRTRAPSMLPNEGKPKSKAH